MLYRCDTDVIDSEFDALFGPMLRNAEPPTPHNLLITRRVVYRYWRSGGGANREIDFGFGSCACVRARRSCAGVRRISA